MRAWWAALGLATIATSASAQVLVRVGDPSRATYSELHEALHSRVPDIEYVDLRFDDRVFVRPGKSIVQKTRAVTP